MAVKIIEKDVRPAKGKGQDEQVITLSEKQVDCFQAQPADFTILTSEDAANAEYIGDGQHGTNAAECRKIKEASASDRGKSRLSK